jgi:DNA excision repair protein ERCC-2
LNSPAITIAVRSLVETVLRSGDLHHDFLGSIKAVEGIRAHQHIQGRRPDTYRAEVAVRHLVRTGDADFIVTGRIDGVLQETSATVVEEIKSTRRSFDDLEQHPNPIHWAQAQCYAYMLAYEEKLDRIDVRLTYVHIDSFAVHKFVKSFGIKELATFFQDLVNRYAKWVAVLARWIHVRDTSIQAMGFPFSAYRPGQRDMAVAVYRTLRDAGHLLVQAATGIGKTMAVLFPAIKALPDEAARKVVFLTARTTGRLAAEAALELLRKKGLNLKSVSLTAKDKICFHPEAACLPDECPCARGYFDRLDQALEAALAHANLTRTRVEVIAKKHTICPFEFSLELVDWADCVICDYNYAFAPGVMLQRLFGDQGGQHTILVDEAHNLVDRAREMFSAQLDKAPILALRRQLKDELPNLYRALGRINAWMASARRVCRAAGGEHAETVLPDILMERLRTFLRQAEKWLSLNLKTAFREALLSLFFEVARFARVGDGYDPRYVVIYSTSGEDLRVKLFCIDPSRQLSEAWRRSHAAVLFSATLTPAGYFQSVLGCPDSTHQLNLGSPFPPLNLSVFVADAISTFYRDRQASASQVCQSISELVKRRSGNYLLYFPSYAYMEQIHDQFVGVEGEIQTLLQRADMDDTQREHFLSRFRADSRQSLVGFAVLGGVFGEGIDLKGERLSGVVIVGVGLPGICLERDLIRSYYERTCGDGFAYAYQYPGINRVLQAAGRVIRSETDRGVIYLIDRRYGQGRYRALLPPHWQPTMVGKGEGLGRLLRQFWDGRAKA